MPDGRHDDGGACSDGIDVSLRGRNCRRFVLAQYLSREDRRVPRLVTAVAQPQGILTSASAKCSASLIEGQDDISRLRLATYCARGFRAPTLDHGGRHRRTPQGHQRLLARRCGNAHSRMWFRHDRLTRARLNFLELLRAGHDDYVINAEALAYMRQRGVGRPCDRSPGRASRTYAIVGRKAWNSTS